MDGIINIKVILLGEAGVGKTSVLLRFKNGEFRESTKQTFIDYHAKKIKVRDKEVTLSLWDTAGQEQFRSIVRSYYRQADGVLLLYDVTNVTTFHVLTGWLSDLRSNNEHAKVIIVGNKNENPAKKSVAVSAVKSFAQQEGLDYQEVSAKSGANIDKVFLLLVEKILIEKGILPPLNETTSLPTRAAPPPPVQKKGILPPLNETTSLPTRTAPPPPVQKKGILPPLNETTSLPTRTAPHPPVQKKGILPPLNETTSLPTRTAPHPPVQKKGILPPLNETTSLPTRTAPPPPVQSPVSTKSTEPETNPIETNSSSAENNIKLHNELSPGPRNKKKGCC